MAVSSCDLSWSGKSLEYGSSDGRNRDAQFVSVYQIVHAHTDALEDIAVQATTSTPNPLPLVGDPYLPGTFVFCKKVSLKRVSPIYSLATVTWSGEFGPSGLTDSPLNKPPTYTWTSKTTEEEIDEDWNGLPIVTANNEPIPGLKRQICDGTLVVKRNFLTASVKLANQYMQATNSDSITIPGFADVWDPGQALMRGYTADYVQGEAAKSQSYVAVTATIEFRTPYRTTAAKAWYARVRHEGYIIRTTRGGVDYFSYATDDDKAAVTKPVLLTATGARERVAANATWLEFQRYGSMAYSALGLW